MSALGNGSLSGFNFKPDSVLQRPEPLGSGGFTYKYESNQMKGGKKHKKHHTHHHYPHHTRLHPHHTFSSKSFRQSIRSRTKSRSKSTLRLGGKRSKKSRKSRK